MHKILEDSLAQFKGKIYPDGTLSVGYCPAKKKLHDEIVYDREYESQLDRYDYTINKYGRTEYHTETFFSKSVNPSRFTKGSQLSQEKTEKKRYGSKGISKKGKLAVRNIAVLLERKYGIKRLGFGTCTLPGFCPEQLKIISRYWSQITRRFYQSLKRKLKKANAPMHYVGVSEVQPSRWLKRKEIGLHLHFAYVAIPRKSGRFYVSAAEFREMWSKAVTNVIRKYAPTIASMQLNFGGSVHLEVVKKSVSGYLGKYISKGVNFCKELIKEGLADCLPGQWWTASRESKNELKNAIVHIDKDLAFQLFYDPESWKKKGVLSDYVSVFAVIGIEEKRIGIAGRVTYEFYRFLLTIQKDSRRGIRNQL